MPATEATAETHNEVVSYEFAFHVLPTVAEGEVPVVLENIKSTIIKSGAEIFDSEAPERIDLAYPVLKHMEGKNRKFTSAYFGWVRFRLSAEKLESLMEELLGEVAILRHLTIKLTKVEEAKPFRFHEHRKSVKMQEVVSEDAELLAVVPTEIEAHVVVEEKALEESLEKITNEEKIV